MWTISDWADNFRNEREKLSINELDKKEDIRAIDVIESLLNGEQSATTAARSIAEIYEPRIKTNHRKSVGILWGTISEASKFLAGSAPELLADLMLAIRELPDVIVSKGCPAQCDNIVCWRDLPEWGRTFREYGIGELVLLASRAGH